LLITPDTLTRLVFGQRGFVGVDNHHAIDAVDDDGFVLADQLAGVAQGQNGRQIETARQNCGMGSRATDIGNKSQILGVFEQHHVGRRQIVRNQNTGAAMFGRARQSVLTGQRLENTFGNLLDVLAAFAQVLFFDLIELGKKNIELAFKRPLGIAVFFLDQRQRVFGQRMVIEQHDVQAQKRAQLGWGVLRDAAPEHFQLFACAANRFFKARHFGGYAIFGHGVESDFHIGAREHMRRTDGDAAANANPLQTDAHTDPPSSPSGGDLFAFAEFISNQSDQSRHGLVLVRPIERFNGDMAAFAGSQHHHAHNRLGVHPSLIAANPDFALKLAGELGKLARSPRMQPELVNDFHFLQWHVMHSLFHRKPAAAAYTAHLPTPR